MSRAILEINDVVRLFGGIAALTDASFSVAERSITALIGPNGAGKTTLFNVVSGFLRPHRGTVRFAGARIDGDPPHKVVRRGLVRTFQITKALTRLTVLENVMLAAPAQPGEKLTGVILRPARARAREREVRAQAMEILHLVGLDALADDRAGTLSGGQRKLLEFARALMVSPRMLLLDEPMAGVNPTLGHRLLDHMRSIRDERDVTVLFIEHDMEVVMNTAEHVIVMNEGRVIVEGSPDAVRADRRVIDAYLGERAPQGR